MITSSNFDYDSRTKSVFHILFFSISNKKAVSTQVTTNVMLRIVVYVKVNFPKNKLMKFLTPNEKLVLTLFPMGYFPTDFPWQVVAASPAHANDFLNF